MWGTILSIIASLLGFFKPKSDTQQAHDDGVKEGQAVQGKATDDAIIKDIGEANDARQSVRDAPASSLRDSDGYRRD